MNFKLKMGVLREERHEREESHKRERHEMVGKVTKIGETKWLDENTPSLYRNITYELNKTHENL